MLALNGTQTSGSAADDRGDTIATDIESVISGAGNDMIDALNHRLDDIDCCPGRDEVIIDTIDRLERCESSAHGDPLEVFRDRGLPPAIPVPPPVPAPTVDAATTLKLTLPSRTRRQALARGLTVTATCSQACRLTARLQRGSTTLARGQAAASGRVALRFTAAGKRALRGKSRVRARLVVQAVDGRGRVVSTWRTVTLR